MPALLLCVGLLATAAPASALGEVLPSLGVPSPCKNGHQCSCPTDVHNYITNIPGYVEECTEST